MASREENTGVICTRGKATSAAYAYEFFGTVPPRQCQGLSWSRLRRRNLAVTLTAASSGRLGAGAPSARRRWRHDLPGERPRERDHDQLPGRGADGEGSGVMRLENAQHVGDLFAAARAGPTPADHHPLTDIGGREMDFEPVAHAGHPSAHPARAAGER